MKNVIFTLLLLCTTQSFAKKQRGEKFHIAAVGDILIHSPLRDQSEASKSFIPLWRNTLDFIKDSDLAYGNVEGPMADSMKRQAYKDAAKNGFNFPSFLARDLKSSGFDIVSTANNHSLDRGEEGLKKTIDVLNHYKLPYIGTRKNSGSTNGFYHITKKGSVNVAWIACTNNMNGRKTNALVAHCSNHKQTLTNIIAHIKKNKLAQIIILTPHWGDEKESVNSTQRRLANSYFYAGVDIIIGAHPHVLQGASLRPVKDRFGQTKNRLVLYSLGNFVSNQVWWGADQRTGAIANIYFKKHGWGSRATYSLSRYSVIPVTQYHRPHYHLQVRTAESISEARKKNLVIAY